MSDSKHQNLIRRLNLAQTEHRATANKLDALVAGRAYLPATATEALAAIDREIADTIQHAEHLIAEDTAARRAEPVLLVDHHGRIVGRR